MGPSPTIDHYRQFRQQLPPRRLSGKPEPPVPEPLGGSARWSRMPELNGPVWGNRGRS